MTDTARSPEPSPRPLPSAGLADAGTAPAVDVSLIGYGYAGATIHAPLILGTPGLRLVAVASRRPEAVRAGLGLPAALQPPRVADAQAILLAAGQAAQAPATGARPRPQLVVIASPNDSHAPLAAAALQAGCHVLIDKPMALDAAQAEPLLPLAAQHGVCLSVFHNRRYDGDFLTAQALLARGDEGPLGRLTEAWLHFDRYRPQVRDRWREGDGPGAGLYADLAPHLIDQALCLFGAPLALQADIAHLRDGGRSDDAFCCRLRYRGGLRVSLCASMLSALPGPRFALHGTRGSWIKHGLDTQEDALKRGLRPGPGWADAQRADSWAAQTLDRRTGQLCSLDPVTPGGDTDPAEPQQREWPNLPGRWPQFYADLRDAVCGLGPNPVPAAQALAVMQLMDLGRRSAAERRELPCVLS